MPLVEIEVIQLSLSCPRCRGSIAGSPYTCQSCLLQFPDVDGKPVLVDFSQSVLDREEMMRISGGSPLPRSRRSGIRERVTRFILGENKTAAKQIDTFLEIARGLSKKPKVLVVGGGSVGSGLQNFYNQPDVDVIAFDIYSTSNVQFMADGHRIPLHDSCIDGVIIQAVLEHVVEPQQVAAEIERVLRSGGVVYADTPFLQQVHEGPYDFTRFTESGHRYLFKNFTEVRSGVVGGLGAQMVWSIDYLFRGLFRSRKAGGLARILFFWLRFLDLFIPIEYAVDGASGCFFMGTRNGETLTPREVIDRYWGAQKLR